MVFLNEIKAMNVISRKVLLEFSKRNTDAKDALLTWFIEARKSTWASPQDIKNNYRSASFLKNNIVIFNIKGNRYRLVVKVAYNSKTVFIKWIGTHAEYNKINF